MTKEVWVSIKGLQFDASSPDNEPIEVIVAGEYYNRNGKHYVIYEEANEYSKIPDKVRLKFTQDYMEMTKNGAGNTHMIFEKNQKNVTYYYTPYGSLQIGVEASKVDVTEGEEEILADVEYNLEMNSEQVAECTIHVEVKPKGSKVTL